MSASRAGGSLSPLHQFRYDTVLANVGCLAVFQVADNDARQLVWELGKDRVSEEDIVSLPAHHRPGIQGSRCSPSSCPGLSYA